jgi:hypothetical protein
MKQIFLLSASLLLFTAATYAQNTKAGDEALGIFKYENFEKPDVCGSSCHTDFYQQWSQAMMSQCYTHHWDDIE